MIFKYDVDDHDGNDNDTDDKLTRINGKVLSNQGDSGVTPETLSQVITWQSNIKSTWKLTNAHLELKLLGSTIFIVMIRQECL